MPVVGYFLVSSKDFSTVAIIGNCMHPTPGEKCEGHSMWVPLKTKHKSWVWFASREKINSAQNQTDSRKTLCWYSMSSYSLSKRPWPPFQAMFALVFDSNYNFWLYFASLPTFWLPSLITVKSFWKCFHIDFFFNQHHRIVYQTALQTGNVLAWITWWHTCKDLKSVNG